MWICCGVGREHTHVNVLCGQGAHTCGCAVSTFGTKPMQCEEGSQETPCRLV